MTDVLNNQSEKVLLNAAWNVKAHLVSDHHDSFQIIAPCLCCQEVFRSEVIAHKSLTPEQLEEMPHTQHDYWERFTQEQFRYCKDCARWVCRETCWEAIRLKCEACANPSLHLHHQSHNKPEKEDQESVYSSILGGICQYCNMVLPAQDKSCPECGKSSPGQ